MACRKRAGGRMSNERHDNKRTRRCPCTVSGGPMKNGFRVFFTSAALPVGAGAALVACSLYTPTPDMPHLSGSITKDALTVGGRQRTYFIYVPHNIPPNAPKVMVLHG